MASDAKDCCIKFCGSDGGIVGVLRERAVTRFTIDACVLACVLGIGDIGMAGCARVVAGKVNRVRGDLANGGGAVMAVLAKAARYHAASYRPKHQKRNHKQARKTEEMSCVFQEIHPAPSS
jgi:hypothetical protein